MVGTLTGQLFCSISIKQGILPRAVYGRLIPMKMKTKLEGGCAARHEVDPISQTCH